MTTNDAFAGPALARPLDAAGRCRALADDLLHRLHGSPRSTDDREDTLQAAALMLFGKSLDTFDALVVLCREGWGVEATVLLRVLLEAVVNMAFIARFRHAGLYLFLEYSQKTDRDLVTAIDSIAARGELPDDVRAKRESAASGEASIPAALDSRLGPLLENDPLVYKHNEATGKPTRLRWKHYTTKRRACLCDLTAWYEEVYALVSHNIHADAGIQGIYLADGPGPNLRLGPKPAWAKAVLPLACRLLLHGTAVLDEVFGLKAADAIARQSQELGAP